MKFRAFGTTRQGVTIDNVKLLRGEVDAIFNGGFELGVSKPKMQVQGSFGGWNGVFTLENGHTANPVWDKGNVLGLACHRGFAEQ